MHNRVARLCYGLSVGRYSFNGLLLRGEEKRTELNNFLFVFSFNINIINLSVLSCPRADKEETSSAGKSSWSRRPQQSLHARPNLHESCEQSNDVSL